MSVAKFDSLDFRVYQDSTPMNHQKVSRKKVHTVIQELHHESPLTLAQFDVISSILAQIGREDDEQERLREMGSAALKELIQMKDELATPGDATELSPEALLTISGIATFCKIYVLSHPEPKRPEFTALFDFSDDEEEN